MIVTHPAELDGLHAIGRICANAVQIMAKAMEHGMTTADLDAIGRDYLAQEGAVSAPKSTYKFPGYTCISVNEEVAHGIPGKRVLKHGDLVNIDVSASKDGFFADTGASFGLGSLAAKLDKLCRDGARARDIGIAEVVVGAPLANIGKGIGHFAKRGGYTLIQNLASHGVGRSLHEYPEEIATWPNRDKRVITEGLVLTIEPFLSLGGREAIDWDEDDWTLFAYPARPTVQYEHTIVATADGPVITTLADI